MHSTNTSMFMDAAAQPLKTPFNSKRIMHTFHRSNLSRDQSKALPPPPIGQTLGHGILNSKSLINKFENQITNLGETDRTTKRNLKGRNGNILFSN